MALVRVSEETHQVLIKHQGKMQEKTGKRYSMNDVISYLAGAAHV